ncbi:hypothetical protein F4818DRAFT_454163 [Hypoxylon cercidicola]|nr:hypothetical protein F4818DRAFT_454163 [Hypoxylon cercidicola]
MPMEPLEKEQGPSSYTTPIIQGLYYSPHAALDGEGPSSRRNSHFPTHDDYLQYLTLLARNLPDRWVCEACMALHPVHQWDLPRSPQNTTCPLGLQNWRRRVHYGLARIDRRHIPLDHRHVQLALKYTRTKNPDYREYLRDLLEPTHTFRFRPFGGLRREPPYATPTLSPFLNVQYETEPRIAVGRDGVGVGGGEPRFLLRSTWRYFYKYKDLLGGASREGLGDLAICPHVELAGAEHRRLHCRHGYNPALEDAIDRAISDSEGRAGGRGAAVRGACARCPTDFAVRATPDFLELRVWQDMGTEGAPTELSWGGQAPDPDGRGCGRSFQVVGPAAVHVPGAVRALYEARQDPGLRRPSRWHIVSRVRRFLKRHSAAYTGRSY